MTDKKSTENMTFEQAILELEQIVKKIDTGEQNLDDSIASYERGIFLRDICNQKLNEAKLKIEKIVKKDDDIKLESVEL